MCQVTDNTVGTEYQSFAISIYKNVTVNDANGMYNQCHFQNLTCNNYYSYFMSTFIKNSFMHYDYIGLKLELVCVSTCMVCRDLWTQVRYMVCRDL